MKKILGFTGLIASGKGTACNYLIKKHGAVSFKFSKILRDILDRAYLPHSRDNLVKISMIMRETFGQDLLAKAIAQDIKNTDKELIVVDGVRRPDDIKYLKDIPGFKLVAVDTDEKIRYERLIQRTENIDDKTKTWEEFVKDHKAETEVYIPELIKSADIKIINDTSLEELYNQLDKLV